jgi:hypothetical protein
LYVRRDFLLRNLHVRRENTPCTIRSYPHTAHHSVHILLGTCYTYVHPGIDDLFLVHNFGVVHTSLGSVTIQSSLRPLLTRWQWLYSSYLLVCIHNPTFQLEPWGGDYTTEVSRFLVFTNLKKTNQNLKTVIAVGGWSFNDPGTATTTRFNLLVESLVKGVGDRGHTAGNIACLLGKILSKRREELNQESGLTLTGMCRSTESSDESSDNDWQMEVRSK